MAKFVKLRRTKSEPDLPELKAKNGIKLLVDLAEGDLPVLDFLNNYIQVFLDGSFHGNTEFYLRTHQFLSQLEHFYRSSHSQCPFYLLSFFRHIVTLLSEVLFTSAQSDVCRVAIETTIVTSPKVKVQMRDLASVVSDVQALTLKLELAISQNLQETNDFRPLQFDSKSVITQTEQIWKVLQKSEGQLKVVSRAVEDKAASDQRFFQTASLGIGAACAGRFVWSLWKGESTEGLMNAGLWSISAGLSGVVLQIPRVRARQILDELAKHKTEKQELQDMLKHWLRESDGLCARLVLFSSATKGKYA